jgi:hypothetical protein
MQEWRAGGWFACTSDGWTVHGRKRFGGVQEAFTNGGPCSVLGRIFWYPATEDLWVLRHEAKNIKTASLFRLSPPPHPSNKKAILGEDLMLPCPWTVIGKITSDDGAGASAEVIVEICVQGGARGNLNKERWFPSLTYPVVAKWRRETWSARYQWILLHRFCFSSPPLLTVCAGGRITSYLTL